VTRTATDSSDLKSPTQGPGQRGATDATTLTPPAVNVPTATRPRTWAGKAVIPVAVTALLVFAPSLPALASGRAGCVTTADPSGNRRKATTSLSPSTINSSDGAIPECGDVEGLGNAKHWLIAAGALTVIGVIFVGAWRLAKGVADGDLSMWV
jgi:hypothetical protein